MFWIRMWVKVEDCLHVLLSRRVYCYSLLNRACMWRSQSICNMLIVNGEEISTGLNIHYASVRNVNVQSLKLRPLKINIFRKNRLYMFSRVEFHVSCRIHIMFFYDLSLAILLKRIHVKILCIKWYWCWFCNLTFVYEFSVCVCRRRYRWRF